MRKLLFVLSLGLSACAPPRFKINQCIGSLDDKFLGRISAIYPDDVIAVSPGHITYKWQIHEAPDDWCD